MIIQYDIVVTILNIIDNSKSKFKKTFDGEITATTDALLYNNYHILSKGVYILDMFENEVDAYCKSMGIERSSIEVDEFEIVSLSENAEVFFESDEEDNSLSLKPTIKCYIHPKNAALPEPTLIGTAYDSTTIIWTWPNDEQYAHYLVEEAIDPNSEDDKGKIIAQLPIGATSYTETGLEPDTPYTRRLINYTEEQTSTPSASVTVMTETVEASQSLEEYTVQKNYDFTTQDSERDIIEENLEAFHSGIGDNNDLKVYKQMDADFYQKFKAYFEITGRRFQKEKRYDQVGFNYKICLEATEEIEEQEGEVTFETDVYPREWVTIEDYMWTTAPVEVAARMTATVFLRKPVEKEDTEEVVIYKPKKKPVYKTVTFNKPTALIISCDLSSSMSQTTKPGSSTRITKAKRALKKLVNYIHKKALAEATANGQTMPANLIQYIICGWGSNAGVLYSGTDKDAAISAINGLVPGKYGDYTNFHKGLNVGKDKVRADRQVVGQIFFTDGFCNSCTYNGRHVFGIGYHINRPMSDNCDKILNSINSNIRKPKTYVIFGNGVNYYDTDYNKRYSSYARNIKDFGRKIVNKCKSEFGSENVFYPGDNK